MCPSSDFFFFFSSRCFCSLCCPFRSASTTPGSQFKVASVRLTVCGCMFCFSAWFLSGIFSRSAPRKLSLSSNWLPRRADSSNRHAGCSSSLLSQFISPQRPLLSLSVSISLFISSSSPQTTRSVIGSSGGKPPPAERTKLLHNLKEGKGSTHSSLDLCFASCFSDFFTVFVVFSPLWLFKCLRAENTRLLVFLLSSFIPRLSFPAHHSSPSLSLMHTVTVYDTVL